MKWRLFAVAALGTAAMAGCGGNRSSAPDVRTVVLDVRFSTFSQPEITVRPGEVVRFVVRNHDPIPHELIVGDEAVQDHHERGTEAHHRARPGEVSVGPGETADTVYTFFKQGTVLFGCHLPGHWAYGMHGTVRVV